MPMLRANGFKEAYARNGIPDNLAKAPSGAITVYEVRDNNAAKRVAAAEVSIAKRATPKPSVLALPQSKPKKKGRKSNGPAGLVCLRTYQAGGGPGFHPFRQDCDLAAKQYVLEVDIFWQGSLGSIARQRANDPGPVLALINKQLALTPQ